MARPLRIEFPGAIYHVTSRGDRREPIFVDDVDREALIAVLATGMSRFDAQVLAYCLMGNHYHFVLHTRQANLSPLMRHVNGVYTQAFNRRHRRSGICCRDASKIFTWTAMPICWRCAAIWS
jgi:REP element-mobilizing transposase RayT